MRITSALLFVLLAACGATHATEAAETARPPERALAPRTAALLEQASAPAPTRAALEARRTLFDPEEPLCQSLDGASMERLVGSSVQWLRSVPSAVLQSCIDVLGAPTEPSDRPECGAIYLAGVTCRCAARHREFDVDPYRVVAEELSGIDDDCPEDHSPLAAAAAAARYATWIGAASPQVIGVAEGRCTIATLRGPILLSPDQAETTIETAECVPGDSSRCWMLLSERSESTLIIAVRSTTRGWRGVDATLPGLVDMPTF